MDKNATDPDPTRSKGIHALGLDQAERNNFSEIWNLIESRLTGRGSGGWVEPQRIQLGDLMWQLVGRAEVAAWNEFCVLIGQVDDRLALVCPDRWGVSLESAPRTPFDTYHAVLLVVALWQHANVAAARTPDDATGEHILRVKSQLKHLSVKLLQADHSRIQSVEDFSRRLWPPAVSQGQSTALMPAGPLQNAGPSGAMPTTQAPVQTSEPTSAKAQPARPLPPARQPATTSGRKRKDSQEQRRSQPERTRSSGVSEKTQAEKDRAERLRYDGVPAGVLCDVCSCTTSDDGCECFVYENPERDTIMDVGGYTCMRCRTMKIGCSFTEIGRDLARPDRTWDKIYAIQAERNEQRLLTVTEAVRQAEARQAAHAARQAAGHAAAAQEGAQEAAEGTAGPSSAKEGSKRS
ncbi:hypothetical protein NKR23_g7278 [Pleurostoma richardsiae]|uniref:Uncharacterized protein n=1 Tax=Pleurostoma richardsiae TaxID=41990 RepID=A0AA38RTV6_9PEZI|nr:hypothetical protein NKR23_g7278 [Pleurostoma richardsiae]